MTLRFRFPRLDITVLLVAVAVKLLQPAPAWVERHYSNGFYPPFDRFVRFFTQAVPLCVGDVLLGLALALLAAGWFRALSGSRRGRGERAGRMAFHTVATLGAIFIWFMLSWAFNYQRIPLADKIPVHNARTNEASVNAYGDRVVDELSRYVAPAHRETLTDAQAGALLVPTFTATIARLGDRAAFAPPRIKPTIFQPYFQMSGTTGFTDPWTHEVNLDASAPRFERPAIFAHEWAHVSGFADESEANFISVIACTTSTDPLLRYSGWILIWSNLGSNVHVTHRLSRLAYADLKAIRDYYERHVNKGVARASQAAYDSYLKGNHVKAGYASYHLFVRWLTGADFDKSGLPIVARAGPSAP